MRDWTHITNPGFDFIPMCCRFISLPLYIFILEMFSTSMFDISISLVSGLIKIETKFSPLSPSLIAITKIKYNSHRHQHHIYQQDHQIKCEPNDIQDTWQTLS